ncbi:hypothetical protein FVP74_11965 [Microbacterium saccharophilum]|uniref:Uncharacterized protein n=1 Tax=Microbacterium saccharophilum TaxID=1213358 RepID=A0A5C8HV21_9MICO|nr:hypothetical protein [Microbacterium saccharophilum]TXK08806.1 hypothetical protein FVP74_11965 [Microbacterium saccharophilum]GEP49179.1 hypothetical protein MSA03_26870 [Microbacterium saccharophilum]
MSELDDLVHEANQQQQDRQALYELWKEHGGGLCVTRVHPNLQALVDDFIPRIPRDAGGSAYWIQRSALATVHRTPERIRPWPGAPRRELRRAYKARVTAMETERRGEARILTLRRNQPDDADREFPFVWLQGEWRPARDIVHGPDWWAAGYDFTREDAKTVMVRFLQDLAR